MRHSNGEGRGILGLLFCALNAEEHLGGDDRSPPTATNQ